VLFKTTQVKQSKTIYIDKTTQVKQSKTIYIEKKKQKKKKTKTNRIINVRTMSQE
jgi:hypothetical protein